MIKLFSLGLILLSNSAFAQSYDEAQRQLYDQQRQTEQQIMIQRFQAQNAAMQNAAYAFAASRGENVQSGPNCKTINDSEPITSYWPNSLAERANDPYKSTAFRQCDFSTSGGAVCKSEYAVSHAALATEVECISQGREERYLVSGSEVHVITARDNLWGAEPIHRRSRHHH